ncbi:MAG: hypothetical protein JWN78_1549 [Bacteroidota bacterium]|nr:hypothetical protein [Bacteroidota bacterium]
MTIQQIINNLLEIIISVENNNKKQNLEFPLEFTFHHVLERIENNLVSLDVLIKNNVVRHDHAIGLISRNLLSDFILTGFMILESGNEEELISKLYSNLHADLKKMDSYIEIQKESGKLSEEEYETIKKKYSEENTIHAYIRKYGSEIKDKIPTNKLIFQTFLKSENQNGWRRHIVDAYDLWIFFSKYEHAGWFSYDFTRELKKDKIEHNIHFVLLCTTLMASSCYDLLKNEAALSEAINLYKTIYSS